MSENLQQKSDGSWEAAKPIGPRIVSWRDVDHHGRLRFGVTFWNGGGEISLGRRMYRWRVTR